MKKRILILNIFLIILFNLFLPYFSIATETGMVENVLTASEPTINSQAGILIELNSGNVLFSKNASEKMYPASTTKIMTAILALEKCDLSEKATVSKNAIKLVPSGYTNAKLVAGEEMSIEDLLYGLMLNSANEAANVIAEHISGSIEEFSKLMTEKAKELGCTNTNFVNANGMHDENHYTTAEDLAKIAIYCMKNEEFRKIVSTVEYKLPATNVYTKDDRIMKNTNLLINPTSQYYYKYAIGVKTGFTTQAGNCLVSFAEKDGTEVVCITLKAGSTTDNSSFRFADSKSLLEYGLDQFSNTDIIKEGKIYKTIEIQNATKNTKNLKIKSESTVSDYISNSINISELTPEITLKDNINAPIKKGEKLGTITYKINDKEYSSDLIADNDVEKDNSLIYYSIGLGGFLLIVGLTIFIIKRK